MAWRACPPSSAHRPTGRSLRPTGPTGPSLVLIAVTYTQARQWALALPGTSEEMVEAWGHPILRVAGKKFASGGPNLPSMTLKASREKQAALVRAAPDTYAVAPYVGRHGWVEVTLSHVEPDQLRELLFEAWRQTAPRKLVTAYDDAALA